jgi:hypothetical protein
VTTALVLVRSQPEQQGHPDIKYSCFQFFVLIRVIKKLNPRDVVDLSQVTVQLQTGSINHAVLDFGKVSAVADCTDIRHWQPLRHRRRSLHRLF